MSEKIVLIGAGSAMFTRGLVSDLLRREWDAELALVDTDPSALEVAEKLCRKMITARKAKLRLSASTQRREVLKDATAVICTVGVGGRRAWEQDIAVPRKHGIYQPVGDSVMPGGTSRSLRMIPAMVAIAQDVLDLAPDALFFNYGNPMATICRAIRKATGANVIGLCHGVHHVEQYLAQVLDVPHDQLQSTAVGMNHLTWFTEVRVRGHDAMPRLRQIARERVERRHGREKPGQHFEEAGNMPKGHVADDHPFTWHLLHTFGAFPAVLDRHVVEFFPHMFPQGKYYGQTLGVDAYSIEQTIAWGDKIYEEMRQHALEVGPPDGEYFKPIGGEHEQVTEIIENIRGAKRVVYSANLPNKGQVPNLPIDAIVESPCIVDNGTLKAVQQKPLPAGVAGTLATRMQWVETTVEAALEGSREKFVQALILDGAVTTIETAEALADDLLKAHAQYLPQFGSASRG